jgi:hypothetical protein
MYKVMIGFRDRMDEKHQYRAGDVYPREGYTPDRGRAEALATAEACELNRRGLEYIRPDETPKALAKLTKAALTELGAEYGLTLDADMKRDDMMEAVRSAMGGDAHDREEDI